jgi:uncharacterized protein YvpB
MTWFSKSTSSMAIYIACAFFMVSLIIISEIVSLRDAQMQSNNSIYSTISEPPHERKPIQSGQSNLTKSSSIKSSSYIITDVPHIKQYPELINGCEVTSVAMLLNFFGLNFSKLELAKKVKKDTTPIKMDATGKILEWGNPERGFVGDITGKNLGYAVYHQPIIDLINEVYRKKTKNLTGYDFIEILQELQNNRPVIVWTTSDFQPTKQWVEWKTKYNQTVRATFKEHVVLLVGFDEHYVYVNDPIEEVGYKKVSKVLFQKSWEQLGKQAVTVY